jgi:hypothetical protein
MVSREKYVVLFSSNGETQLKQEVRQVLHIDTTALPDKYLGLPTWLGD